MTNTVGLGPENNPNVTLEENNDGEPVLRHEPSGATFKYDETAGEWVAADLKLNSLSTESIGSERHYAGAFDGADADARLDNALTAANDGEVIYLENATYSTDRTISTQLVLIGTDHGLGSGTQFTGSWTLADKSALQFVRGGDGGALTVSAVDSMWINGGLTGSFNGVTVSADRFRFIGHSAFSTLTFEAGTSGGIVDSCTQLSVTDNGSNTVGDIA